MGGHRDPIQAMPLADLVEEHAPELITAAAGWGERADTEIARSLVQVWRAGPPYAPSLEQTREHLASHRGPDAIPDSPARPAAHGTDPARIDAIHRLAQRDRVRGRRQRQAALVITAAVVVAAIALVALILPRSGTPTAAPAATPPGVPTPASTSASTPSTAPSSTPAPTSTPTPTPTPTPALGSALTCTTQYCLPENARSWGPQVVAAAYAQLDTDTVFSVNGIIAATGLASDQTGRLLRVTVTAAGTGATVEVWTADQPDRLPTCGAALETTCEEMVTRDGFRIAVAATAEAIEARYRAGSSTVQIVVRNDGRPLQISADQAYDFLVDERLQLPA